MWIVRLALRRTYTFVVVVTDAVQPGADTFRIELSNGYRAGGTVENGNIQIQQ